LLACTASLGTGELIREHLRPVQTFWLVSDTVYLVRDQHLRAPFPLLSPTLTPVLWSIFAIVVVILIRSLRLGTPELSALPEIVAGLFIGGGLANVLEAQMIGSVTDFLGIHRLGTYSAGDIAMDVGSSLLPIAIIQIAQAQHQTFARVLQAGAGFIVAFAVVSQDYALAILVTSMSGGGVAVLLANRSGSPQTPRAKTGDRM
jgi:hypothetical protein